MPLARPLAVLSLPLARPAGRPRRRHAATPAALAIGCLLAACTPLVQIEGAPPSPGEKAGSSPGPSTTASLGPGGSPTPPSATTRRPRPTASATTKGRPQGSPEPSRPRDTGSQPPTPRGGSGEPGNTPLVTFKVLTLIYPSNEIPGQPRRSLTPEALRAARTAAEKTWPRTVSDLTNGDVRIAPTVVVMPPLRSNGRFRHGNDPSVGESVWPEDVEGRDRLVGPRGRYDSVLVWSLRDDGFSWSAGGGASVTEAQVTWATQGLPTEPSGYAYGTAMMGGTTHEWLHGIGPYFHGQQAMRGRAPRCTDDPNGTDGLHCAEEYGYLDSQNGRENWLDWYADILNGRVDGHGSSLGLGPKAWSLGPPRARFGG